MAKFCIPIEKSFVCCTNKYIQEYNCRYDASLILNCLLGFLVVISFKLGLRVVAAAMLSISDITEPNMN
ncbi:MAG: HEPN family nuclease [Acutalibacteraceae bacterium]